MDKKRVLIVDDELNFTRIVKLNLELTGRFEVLTLNSAKDLFENVRVTCPDVILLDMHMPDMAGDEACRLLRKEEQTKEVPVLIISGSDFAGEKINFEKAGIIEYMVKPIERDDLIRKIDDVLALREK